jgi:DNA-binding NarL/FixJ family response regulator
MIKILICDDHAVVRQGLRQIIEDCDDISLAGEAQSGEELIQMIGNDDIVDVVVLDIAMDGIGGIEALKEIKSRKPELAVLMLSMHPEDQYAIRVLQAGASGYLTKKSAPAELIQAVRTVANGKKYITASVSEKLVSNLNVEKEVPPHEMLSDREHQVFIKLAEGKTVGQTAENLHISVKTVSTYKTRIMEKMGCNNISELVRYALEQRLI